MLPRGPAIQGVGEQSKCETGLGALGLGENAHGLSTAHRHKAAPTSAIAGACGLAEVQVIAGDNPDSVPQSSKMPRWLMVDDRAAIKSVSLLLTTHA